MHTQYMVLNWPQIPSFLVLLDFSSPHPLTKQNKMSVPEEGSEARRLAVLSIYFLALFDVGNYPLNFFQGKNEWMNLKFHCIQIIFLGCSLCAVSGVNEKQSLQFSWTSARILAGFLSSPCRLNLMNPVKISVSKVTTLLSNMAATWQIDS